jgi:hypothetical protein
MDIPKLLEMPNPDFIVLDKVLQPPMDRMFENSSFPQSNLNKYFSLAFYDAKQERKRLDFLKILNGVLMRAV